MGSKIHFERNLLGFNSVKNFNDDRNSWSLFFEPKNVVTNTHYYGGFSPHKLVDVRPKQQKDALKQKMLEHEAVFKNQVCELHRLYRIQRNMMDEAKRLNEPNKHQASMEPASSSSVQRSKATGKWHMAGFPMLNSNINRTPISEVEFVDSYGSFENGSTSNGHDRFDSRPMKVRKKLFLHLPEEEFIDDKSSMTVLQNGHHGIKIDFQFDASASHLTRSVGLADLNNPVSSFEFFGCALGKEEAKCRDVSTKSNRSQVHHPNGICLNGYSQELPWKEGLHQSLDLDSNYDCPNEFYEVLSSTSRFKGLPVECRANHWLEKNSNGARREDSQPGTVIDLNEDVTKSSSDEFVTLQNCNMTGRIKPEDHISLLSSDSQTVNILGFPISDETSSLNQKRNGIIDINVPCEEDDQAIVEELMIEKVKRDYIDLNTCASDCDDTPMPGYDIKCGIVKATLKIDLEASVFPDRDGDNDVVLRNAAEAIVAISSTCPQICSSEKPLEESLNWFVDSVSLYAKMDEFEAMALLLEEAKEEHYIPWPSVCFDKTVTNAIKIGSRRGVSRRGRQRRDFQQDFLPGMATLARHEVTEDVQTFGGLMRDLGHPWNSGLARRNGCTRGRKRAVAETIPFPIPRPVCPSVEKRKLSKWGKTTTQRPRRQSVGNPSPAAVLS